MAPAMFSRGSLCFLTDPGASPCTPPWCGMHSSLRSVSVTNYLSVALAF